MALGVTDLKKGRIIMVNNQPYKVMEYAQKVMGRGGSIVNVKIKSLVDGKVFDKTYKGNETIDEAAIDYRRLQFLYEADKTYHFMDNQTYEQYELNVDTNQDIAGFIKEGDEVQAQLLEGNLLTIDLPKNVPLQVTYTEDVVKGDTTSSIQKDAELETGISVKVPAFINIGDIVSVDTETGVYRERISK